MTAHWNGYHSALATHIEQYLRAKRAMGCKFACEGRQLRLLDRFLAERGVDRIDVIDGACLQAFLDSRHRTNPRSYNNLLGDIRRLFDWIVGQQLLSASPLAAQAKPQRAQRIPFLFSPEVIRRLLVLARSLPDNPRAPQRGHTYEMIFALLAGLGLRVGEVAGLQWGDVDLEREVVEISTPSSARIGWCPSARSWQSDYASIGWNASGGTMSAQAPTICFHGTAAHQSAPIASATPSGTICCHS